MDIPLEKINSIQEKQSAKRAAFFLIIRSQRDNRVKEVSRK
jgi:hypothetical protein